MQTQKLSRLMRLSWEIQRTKKSSRSRSLLVAWAICLHEDITVYYLVKRHSSERNAHKVKTDNLALFNF
jgi:hypothetical protein